ncbi:hypothetical protein ACT4RS_02500, partial [Ornithobacterium rhinotracheale]|uniref:hypothetical protein n=1 Tax=Ornithobacterium rhinotracheale TaxID=28251 RepID=UPI0040350AE6
RQLNFNVSKLKQIGRIPFTFGFALNSLVVMNGAGHLPRYRPSWRNKVVFPEILNFIERDTQNLHIEKIEY